MRLLDTATVSHTDRCSDAETYHQESDTVRANAPGASASAFMGNGSTDANGPNEATIVTLVLYPSGLGLVRVTVYTYQSEARDDCYVEAWATGAVGPVRVDCPA